MLRNKDRSGAVGTVPEQDMPRISDIRSGTSDGGTNEDWEKDEIRVISNTRIAVRNGRVVVIAA